MYLYYKLSENLVYIPNSGKNMKKNTKIFPLVILSNNKTKEYFISSSLS